MDPGARASAFEINWEPVCLAPSSSLWHWDGCPAADAAPEHYQDSVGMHLVLSSQRDMSSPQVRLLRRMTKGPRRAVGNFLTREPTLPTLPSTCARYPDGAAAALQRLRVPAQGGGGLLHLGAPEGFAPAHLFSGPGLASVMDPSRFNRPLPRDLAARKRQIDGLHSYSLLC
jgi:hypothetical protein